MNSVEPVIALTIDGKKNRIRIAKATMKMLGEPPMVQLLYNPAQRIIVVRAAHEQTPGGQELYIHLSKPGGDYDIYSLSFVRKMRNENAEMHECCSYRLRGKISLRERLAFFPLATLEKINVI